MLTLYQTQMALRYPSTGWLQIVILYKLIVNGAIGKFSAQNP